MSAAPCKRTTSLMKPRRGLHREGRSGRHRRRIHGPPDGRTPLLRRSASGDRSQGTCDHRSAKTSTLATITFQNYFRMYHKLSGMTGTAKTEEAEFAEHLRSGRSAAFRTNQPHHPQGHLDDMIYRTKTEKYATPSSGPSIGSARQRVSPCWSARLRSKRAKLRLRHAPKRRGMPT